MPKSSRESNAALFNQDSSLRLLRKDLQGLRSLEHKRRQTGSNPGLPIKPGLEGENVNHWTKQEFL